MTGSNLCAHAFDEIRGTTCKDTTDLATVRAVKGSLSVHVVRGLERIFSPPIYILPLLVFSPLQLAIRGQPVDALQL